MIFIVKKSAIFLVKKLGKFLCTGQKKSPPDPYGAPPDPYGS